MSRTTVPITPDLATTLTENGVPCGSCLFWELDPVRRRQVPDDEPLGAVKDAWLSEVLREWGSCGRVALVDGEAVGYLTYAPASFVPGAQGFPTAPVSPDAVLLVTAHVLLPHRGGGIGRLLVQGMARDLVTRGGIRAVEAFGKRGRAAHLQPASRCAVPAEFLARVGFKTQRAHPTTPRMRMDLRAAVTWRDEVEAALERLLGVVRPGQRPTPAHRELN